MKHLVNSTLLLIAIWALTSLSALAQPTSTGPAPGAPAATVPIDGGASLLLAGGVAYGLRRLRTRRQARRAGSVAE